MVIFLFRPYVVLLSLCCSGSYVVAGPSQDYYEAWMAFFTASVTKSYQASSTESIEITETTRSQEYDETDKVTKNGYDYDATETLDYYTASRSTTVPFNPVQSPPTIPSLQRPPSWFLAVIATASAIVFVLVAAYLRHLGFKCKLPCWHSQNSSEDVLYLSNLA